MYTVASEQEASEWMNKLKRSGGYSLHFEKNTSGLETITDTIQITEKLELRDYAFPWSLSTEYSIV